MFDRSEKRTSPGFPGIWNIIDKTKAGGDDVASVAICQSGKIILRNEGENEVRSFEDTYLDREDETLRGFDGTTKIRISFWRQSLNEIIFADLTVAGQNDSGWVARRESSNPTPEIEHSHWRIEARGGPKSAEGCVQLKKVSSVITEKKQFFISGHIDKIVFSYEDLPPGPQLISGQDFADVPETNFLRRHGYALFQYKVVDTINGPAICNESPTLYDILSYDLVVKSFNSIFGYRSLNYVARRGEESARIFATFNSPFLRFFQSFVTPLKTVSLSSPLMDFEKEILSPSSHGKPQAPPRSNMAGDQGEDQDIGIWVGEPL